jgi:hypothetical protein
MDLETRIRIAVENSEAIENIGDFKKSMKELRSLALQAGDSNQEAFQKITVAAGKAKDKIGDMEDAIKSLSGSNIQNAANSFKGLVSNLASGDIDQAKVMFNNLKLSIQSMGMATKVALGIFGLLFTAVGLIIANWDKLSKSTGALGDMIRGLTKKFEEIKKQVMEFADKALTGLINGFIELYNKSNLVRGAIEGIKLTFKTLVDYFVMGAKIIGNVFSTLGGAIMDLVTLKDPRERLKQGFEDIKANVVEFGDKFKTNLETAINNTKNSTLKPIKSLFGTFPDEAKKASEETKEITKEMLDDIEKTYDAITQKQSEAARRVREEREKEREQRAKDDEKELKRLSDIASAEDTNPKAFEKQLAALQPKKRGLTDAQKEKMGKVSGGIGQAQSIASEIGGLLADASANEIANIQNETNERLNALEIQKNAGILSEQEYQNKKAAIQAEAAAKELAARKKAFAIDKAMRISQAVMGTAQAVITALSGGPIIGPILAGIAAAVGAAQIGIISAQSFNGGGGGGSTNVSAPTGGGGQAAPQPSSFFGLGKSNLNAGGGKGDSQRVYVVESDITNTQGRMAKIKERSTLGG